MKPKTAFILTSCCFFAAAIGFLLYAWSLDTIWVIFAIILLALGLALRKVFPASEKLAKDFDETNTSPSKSDPAHPSHHNKDR